MSILPCSMGAVGQNAAEPGVLGVAGARTITAEEDKRVLRRIDRFMMPTILIIYFFVTLDKFSLTYTSVFGIQKDANLVGNEYSLLGSGVYFAQLVFQPISAYALVKFRFSLWVPSLVTLWGICLACGAAATNFGGLFTMRFFLGALESSVAPANIALSQTFYRRAEQANRTALWYSCNGISTILGSLMAYGLGHIQSDKLHSYQIIFLFMGLLTVVWGIASFWLIPDNIEHAYFLKGEDKRIAIERVRYNQAGASQKGDWNWNQVVETFLDPKTWMWVSLAFLISMPSGGFSTFSALILQSFGFDKYQVMLLSIPVGAMQCLYLLAAFWLQGKIRVKSTTILCSLLVTIPGAVMLYALPRGDSSRGSLLAGYYLTISLVVITPLLFAWSSSNVSGRTKRMAQTALFVAGQAGGNIVGPLLFQAKDAPNYQPGLRAALAILCALFVEVLLVRFYLTWLNKRNERRRIAQGHAAKFVDFSMMTAKEVEAAQRELAHNAAIANDQIVPVQSNGAVAEQEKDGKTGQIAELGFNDTVKPMHGALDFEDETDLNNPTSSTFTRGGQSRTTGNMAMITGLIQASVVILSQIDPGLAHSLIPP